MGLVISRNIVLSPAIAADGDKPVIGWQNYCLPANVTADTEASLYPASNVANPQTFSKWKAATADAQYLTFVTGTLEDIDYIAIARHNLATAAMPVSVEGLAPGEEVWAELVGDVVLGGDGPALFRFEKQPLSQIRLKLFEGTAPAEIAVVYFGAVLVLERRIWVGHMPMPDGRKVVATNGRSEAGEFTGRIITQEFTETKVPLSLISPGWFRSYMRPFLVSARSAPFFFAWRPETYPQEVGFAWLKSDPEPVPEGPSNLISLSLQLGGIT